MNDEERESRPQRGRGRGYGGRTSRWHVNPKSNVDTQQNQSPSKTQDNQQKQTQNQSSPPPPSQQQQQQQQQQSKRHEERSQNQRNQRNNYRRNQGKLPIMCMYFISESGCPQENCRYAHGDGELERIRNSRGRRNSENENYGDEQERDYYRGPPKPYRQGRRNDYRRDDRNRNQRNAPQTRDENKGRDGDDEVPERTPALPPDSISKASLQRIAQMVNCRHIQKGCQFLSSKADLPAHMEKCPFERCKDYLANGQIDPIIKYFKKQIRQRDILIADLRSQVANNFKEEEETFGLEEEHINLFKELVFSGAGALQITSTFSSRYPNCQWSVFFHHVSESDLSYVYDGYLQWVYKSRRYILIKLNEDE